MKRLAASVALAVLFSLSPQSLLRAQTCSMCRDTTAGSAPQMRAGLRRAIPVLGIPAAALFLGMLVVAVKTRPHGE